MNARRMGILGTLCAVVSVLGVVAPPPAVAAVTAGIDPDFGGNGYLELGSNRPFVAAVDSQDRALVLNQDGRLWRYDAHGTMDADFGPIDVPANFPSNYWPVSKGTVRVLDDGTISVIRRGADQMEVHRYLPNGQPDTSFSGDGAFMDPDVPDQVRLLERPDGSFVLAGIGGSKVTVLSFDAAGNLDVGFDDDGVLQFACCEAALPPTADARSVLSLVDGGDGRLVLLARSDDDAAVARIGADGTVEPLASVPLTATQAPAHAVVMGDGGVLVASTDTVAGGPSWVVRRYEPNLQPDTTFGTAGTIGFSSGTWGEPIIEADRVIVPSSATGRTSRLVAIDDGGLDASYGAAGMVTSTGPTLPSDAQVDNQSTAAVGLPNGHAVVFGQLSWGPGIFYPYNGSALTIEQFDANGVRVALIQPSSRGWLGSLAAGPTSAYVTTSASAGVGGGGPGGAITLSRYVSVDPAAPVGPVRDVSSTVVHKTVDVSWAPPDPAPGQFISGYDIEVLRPDTGTQVGSTSVTGTKRSFVLPDVGRAYVIDVRARGPLGDGPAVDLPLVVIPHFDSVGDFLERQAVDFAGPGPSANLIEDLIRALAAGTTDPARLVREAALGDAWTTRLHPVVRLYSAYFGRYPDPSGLKHWTAKRAAGTTVARISASFAASSEFQRTYGRLSNKAFVQFVYENVLDRPADPGGLSYWTKRLDSKRTSRGQLMASFSESSEHVRRQATRVRTIALYWGMVHRLPTAGELQSWAGSNPPGDDAALALALLQSPEYLALLD